MPKYRTKSSNLLCEEVKELLSRCEHTTEGCYLWTGSVNSEGYPKLTRRRFDNGKSDSNVKGHRHLYECIHNITLNADQVVRHTCDNPSCLNPKHLVIGTSVDNVDDRVKRGRSRGHVSQREISLVAQETYSTSSASCIAKVLGLKRQRVSYILSKYVK